MNHTTRSALVLASSLFTALLGASSALAQSPEASQCNCSCQRYQVLVANELPNSPAQEQEMLQCAASCAIAWVRCEEQSGLAETRTDNSSDARDEDGVRHGNAIQASLQSDI
ncbi:hypothetical protein [Wenzhouxiangella marina]|uniref:Uncharacterized protein n=1 Tax=Wenzhouxiangella marina TaxID=1579979 RepID=A0A0K0XU00_9GAMM|nr:hypothetical protein [Wenzhouxiangella marina]AKS41101.1 hypothetical protein WM2015_720 [Wenzhouxiangella marina]MBB6087980.1 hypothetical protein [Wenzhouxiangella marina]